LREALTAAIAELPDLYRTVLVLRDVEGLSNLEVAQALGLNVPIVKTRVHRARLFLRKRLDHVMTSDPTIAVKILVGDGSRKIATVLSQRPVAAA
jgi:DNA-directed RNA polymerase specialized sigma24 family protein